MILSDIYKPYTYEEAIELVPPVAAATLTEGGEYGIRWWNRFSRKSHQVSQPTRDGGRRYRSKVAYLPRSRDEWVGVPVPASLPRELVESARAQVNAPRPQERKNLARDWELRGLMRCPSCGGAMTTHTAKRDDKLYHYYRCHRNVDYGRTSCRQRMERAQKAEEAMWAFVSKVMKDPERILVGIDALIERKRTELRGNPDREAASWLERLAEVDQERRGYLKLAAKGRMSEEELDDALAELEETRRTAERELAALGNRRDEIEQLERDRDTIKASWAAAVPENLDRLTPQERNTLYLKLRLEMRPTEDGYEVTGPFCSLEPSS
jgi:Recombinase zinc beta ribbon domain